MSDDPSVPASTSEQNRVASQLLLSRQRSILLVVDMQTRILDAIPDQLAATWNARRLLDAAHLFDVSITSTEQYPERLGPTAEPLQQRMAPSVPKRRFSCLGVLPLSRWRDEGQFQVVLTGIESHVCVLQTALDLLAESFQVHVAVDAVASRHATDHNIAIRSMESAGAQLTTTESVLFQWCEDSRDPNFKAISRLVQESRPD